MEIFVKTELGIGDWGLGIGDWGLGPIPNPQSPIFLFYLSFLILNKLKFKYYLNWRNGETQKRKKRIIMLVLALFTFNIYKFLKTEGSDIPIISILFNLIILFGILILLFHINDIGNEYQTKIEQFFKK